MQYTRKKIPIVLSYKIVGCVHLKKNPFYLYKRAIFKNISRMFFINQKIFQLYIHICMAKFKKGQH